MFSSLFYDFSEKRSGSRFGDKYILECSDKARIADAADKPAAFGAAADGVFVFFVDVFDQNLIDVADVFFGKLFGDFVLKRDKLGYPSAFGLIIDLRHRCGGSSLSDRIQSV